MKKLVGRKVFRMDKVQGLSFRDFGLFGLQEVKFSRGINILLGENSTGKSLVMKLLYSVLSTLNELTVLRDKMKSVFLVERVGRLVRSGSKACFVRVDFSEGHIEFSFSADRVNVVECGDVKEVGSSVYLPAFVSDRIIGLMDGIYLDLVKKFDIPVSVNAHDKAIRDILKRFSLERLAKMGRGDLENTLLAEGYRKLAGLIYLIRNGQIKEGSYLFWDEPEVNLSPALSELVVDLLVFLSTELGVQVFLATHDYFIAKHLDLKKKELGDKLDLKFFSFYKQEPSLVAVEPAKDLYGIKNNPIFAEFEKLLNLEARIHKITSHG